MQDDVHFNIVFKKRGKKSLEITKAEELFQVGGTVQRRDLWLWCGCWKRRDVATSGV